MSFPLILAVQDITHDKKLNYPDFIAVTTEETIGENSAQHHYL